tara:strand:+ start:966 stop:1376 length:411 start_codon:yes stop_codon:yes gene_type:complete
MTAASKFVNEALEFFLKSINRIPEDAGALPEKPIDVDLLKDSVSFAVLNDIPFKKIVEDTKNIYKNYGYSDEDINDMLNKLTDQERFSIGYHQRKMEENKFLNERNKILSEDEKLEQLRAKWANNPITPYMKDIYR